ncbi:MAG TPA: DUF1345 domain-containing protein [Dongiaceae bacterium]|nr:DUF1345 domain-containing protein [Dongiaceae bacterium]
MSTRNIMRDSTFLRLCIAVALGAIACFIAYKSNLGRISLLIGWDVIALTIVTWVAIIILPMKPEQTSRFAVREDPGRVVASTFLTLASIASLAAVASALVEAHSDSTVAGLFTLISIASVILSWVLIHTLYTLHYARLYHAPRVNGSVDFGPDHQPTYIDFIYLAFTIGMTFQVSDTPVSGTAMRRTVIRHAVLSYIFGAVIIATTVSIIASL